MNGLTEIVKLNEQGQTSEVAQAEAILAKHREAGAIPLTGAEARDPLDVPKNVA